MKKTILSPYCKMLILITASLFLSTGYSFAQDDPEELQEFEKKYIENVLKINTDLKDFSQQVSGWEWIYTEESEYKKKNYPIEVGFKAYPSHPQYCVIDGNVYDREGKLVRKADIVRGNYDTELNGGYGGFGNYVEDPYADIKNGAARILKVTDNWKELHAIKRVLQLKMMMDDLKSNKLGTNRESPETIKQVLKMLSWYNYDLVLENEKIVGGERSTTALIIRQLKENHKDELKVSRINEIKRTDNLNFMITFGDPNSVNKTTLLVNCYQKKPYDYEFQISIDGIIWYDSDRAKYGNVDANIRNYYLKGNG